jgi:hypothetical protein
MKTAIFNLVAVNGNEKCKLVFLGPQTIYGNGRLLFQQVPISAGLQN